MQMCDCHECDKPIKRSQVDWDLFFLAQARAVAMLSKDPDRKVGAIVITPDRRQMSFGYNGFPHDIEDRPSLLADRKFKLENIVHAEDNALRQCPFKTMDCTLYVTSFPCRECAEKIMAARIMRVVSSPPDFGHGRWGKSWQDAWIKMASIGIEIQTRLTP